MLKRSKAGTVAAILVVMAITTALAYREWAEYHRARRAVDHSRQVLDSVNSAFELLLQAEDSQRGFLLSGDDRSLDPYRRALQRIPAELANLEGLIAATEVPAGSVARLRGLVDQRLRELAAGIETRRTPGATAGGAAAAGGRTMSEIRSIWGEIRQREYRALTEDPRSGEAVAHIALLVVVGFSLILLFLFAGGAAQAGPPKTAPFPTLAGIAWAAAAAIFATLLRFALTGFVGESSVPFITYFPAILLVSWRAGFRAGAATVLLSGLAAAYFFIDQRRSLWPVNPADEVGLLIFALVGVGMSWLAHSQRRAAQLAGEESARRRDAELAQAEQRQQLRITINSIGDAVIATDAAGRIVLANFVAQRLLRGSERDLVSRPMDDVFRIVNEQSRQPVVSPIEKVLREGVTAGLANHTVLIALDGTEVPIDDSAAPIRGDDGEVVGAVLVFRDITERRKAERNTAFLEALVASTDDAIVGKSLDGIVQTWNAGAERLYGYTAAEIIGRPAIELIPPDRAGEEAEILARLRAGERVSHLETVRRRKDGSMVEVSLTISPVRNPRGEIIGVSHVARDITEYKRTAESLRQSQKLESLGVLAGGIAHDFNNLLVGILGNASLALDDLPTGIPAHGRISDVIRAGERAAQLTRQMLAYSGRGRFVLRHIDLSAEIRETLPLLQAAIPRTVEMRLDLVARLPLVEVDPAQLQQLLMNLIINGAEAIAAGRAGVVAIATRPVRVDRAYVEAHREIAGGELRTGDYVLLEIRDSGSGMDPAIREKIFDPFFTTKFTGRGLGLAAVLGIVRGHGGAIGVSSETGQGTVFRVWLPARADAAKADPQARIQAAPGSGLVLVVDDEEVVRKVAQSTLERYGYSVALATNGSEGVTAFRESALRICCVVLDLTMPVMSGEEALRRIREIRADVPVILSSGYSEAEALRRFSGLGLAGFLQKPYQAAALASKLRQALGNATHSASS